MKELCKSAGRMLKSFMKNMEANQPRGIRTRTRCALICAICFILIDIIFVACHYSKMPDLVPSFSDTDGYIVQARSKAVFFSYDIQRIVILIGTVFLAWFIKRWFKHQIVYERVRCLIYDIVNLFITSIICITMIEISIAEGESVEISYLTEELVFLFWTIVMSWEYYWDMKKIRKSLSESQYS